MILIMIMEGIMMTITTQIVIKNSLSNLTKVEKEKENKCVLVVLSSGI